jgi:oligopeptide transport system substrate-binding protein
VHYVRRSLGATAVLLACVVPVLASANTHGISLRPQLKPPTPLSRPSEGAVLRLAMPDATPTVDPAMVADEQDVQLADMLYSGLVRLDASYHVVPDSASSWTMSPDRRTYLFHLRHDLRFSDGHRVTARDFQYSINRSLSPALKSPSAPTYLTDIEGATAVLNGTAKTVSGVKVLDRYTIRITARWPAPYFLTELTYPTSFALESARLKKLGSVDNFSWYTDPIGSGPYRLKSWEPNNNMVLVPNKHYSHPKPSLRAIRLSFAPLPTSDLYRNLNRSVDVINLCAAQRGISQRPGISEVNTLSIDGLYMNAKIKPFGSRRVRRALALALNRPSLVRHALGHAVTAFSSFVPLGEPGADAALGSSAYDAKAARTLLESAGYGVGKPFPSATLYYPDDPCNPRLGRLAQAMVKAWHKNLRIAIDSHPLTLNALWAKVQTDSLALYLAGWPADYPDPHDSLSLQWESSALNNDVHYHDSRFDDLVHAADATWHYARRVRLYTEAQRILMDDAAWVPLFIPHRIAFIRPIVTNLVLTGYGLIPRSGSWADVGIRSAVTRLRPPG